MLKPKVVKHLLVSALCVLVVYFCAAGSLCLFAEDGTYGKSADTRRLRSNAVFGPQYLNRDKIMSATEFQPNLREVKRTMIQRKIQNEMVIRETAGPEEIPLQKKTGTKADATTQTQQTIQADVPTEKVVTEIEFEGLVIGRNEIMPLKNAGEEPFTLNWEDLSKSLSAQNPMSFFSEEYNDMIISNMIRYPYDEMGDVDKAYNLIRTYEVHFPMQLQFMQGFAPSDLTEIKNITEGKIIPYPNETLTLFGYHDAGIARIPFSFTLPTSEFAPIIVQNMHAVGDPEGAGPETSMLSHPTEAKINKATVDLKPQDIYDLPRTIRYFRERYKSNIDESDPFGFKEKGPESNENHLEYKKKNDGFEKLDAGEVDLKALEQMLLEGGALRGGVKNGLKKEKSDLSKALLEIAESIKAILGDDSEIAEEFEKAIEKATYNALNKIESLENFLETADPEQVRQMLAKLVEDCTKVLIEYIRDTKDGYGVMEGFIKSLGIDTEIGEAEESSALIETNKDFDLSVFARYKKIETIINMTKDKGDKENYEKIRKEYIRIIQPEKNKYQARFKRN